MPVLFTYTTNFQMSSFCIRLYLAPITQVPNDVQLTRVDTGQLTFTWTPVNSNCPSINYMATLDCGTCSIPMGTTVNCSGLQLPGVCSFTVQTMVCGQVGAPSDPLTVTLRGIYIFTIHVRKHRSIGIRMAFYRMENDDRLYHRK